MARYIRLGFLSEAWRRATGSWTPAWPAGPRALLWQTLARSVAAGLVLAAIAALVPLPSVPKPPPPATTLPDLGAMPAPVIRTPRQRVPLTEDPFRADRRFPAIPRRAVPGMIPIHWSALPPLGNPRLRLFGVAGSMGHLRALVGTVRHETWRAIGTFVDGWQLIAIRAHRVLWTQNGVYGVSAVVGGHQGAMARPRPIPLFAGSSP